MKQIFFLFVIKVLKIAKTFLVDICMASDQIVEPIAKGVLSDHSLLWQVKAYLGAYSDLVDDFSVCHFNHSNGFDRFFQLVHTELGFNLRVKEFIDTSISDKWLLEHFVIVCGDSGINYLWDSELGDLGCQVVELLIGFALCFICV